MAIYSMPFSSITTTNNAQTSFISGIVVLHKGDKISLKVSNYGATTPVTFWGAGSHTLLTIESL